MASNEQPLTVLVRANSQVHPLCGQIVPIEEVDADDVRGVDGEVLELRGIDRDAEELHVSVAVVPGFAGVERPVGDVIAPD